MRATLRPPSFLLFFLSYLRPLLEPPRLPLLDELELLEELVPLLRVELLLELLVLALEPLLVRLLEPLMLLELLPLGREVLLLGRLTLLLELVPLGRELLLLLLGRLTLPLVAGRVLEPLTLLELLGREVPLLGRLTEPLAEPLLLGRLTLPLLLPAGRLSVSLRPPELAEPPLPLLMLPTGPFGLTVALGAALLLGLGISLWLLHSGWVAG